MSYVLEKEDEGNRLDYQSTFPRYNFKEEFRDFFPAPGEKILDAGSGSGLVLSHFSKKHPTSSFTGIDFSHDRVNGASKKYESLKNLKFLQGDLSSLEFKDETFNRIISRYVVEHIPKDTISNVFSELYRVLQCGGEFICVDFDGPMFNVYPQTPHMNRVISKIKEQDSLDLWIGRKIPHLAAKAGFKVLDWRIETVECFGQYLEHEFALLPDKFDRIEGWVDEIMNQKGAGKSFKKDYLEILQKEGSTLFYNKFIVRLRKPFEIK